MENSNILICLERLDIGGVETAVFNQAITLKEIGHNVVILAKNGLYTEKLKELGVICIDFSFELENNFNLKKTKEIVDIIREYKIEQVHINQFPCLISAMPAAIITNIPYVAYSHVGTSETYTWYKNCFNLYEDLFKFFYENAEKIVAITDAAKNKIIEEFGINKEKIIVNKNSINFSIIDEMNIKPVNEIKNMLIISRFSKEKEKSIKNAIDLFLYYAKTKTDATLNIIGDGELKDEIKKYIETNNVIGSTINMIGPKNNVLDYINENDIVIGMGRCILEAIAMRRIAVISGYETICTIVDKNVETIEKENFTGRNLKPVSNEELVKQLNDLSKEEINNIVTYNEKYVRNKFDIKNNLYIVNNENTYKDDVVYKVFELTEAIQRKREEKIQLLNENEKKIQKLNSEVEDTKKENQELKQELQKIYSSKRWKLVEKIMKLLNK